MNLSLSLSLPAVAVLANRGLWSPARIATYAWYDYADIKTLYQDAAGTIPVTGPGQPVGLMTDKSGNGNHRIQAVSAARPTYQLDSAGRPCLYFDGVDDLLGITKAGMYSTSTAVFRAARQTGTWVSLWDLSNAARYVGVGEASASASYAGAGTPSMSVNGAAIGSTSADLRTAVGTTVPAIVEVRGANMSTWGGGATGFYTGFTSAQYLYGEVILSEPVAAANRAPLLSYLARKSGAPL